MEPYIVRKIDPNDLPEVSFQGLGISFPLGGPAVFNSTYTTRDAIKHNIINYFLTNPGERPMNPSFGAGLRQLLFTNINIDVLEEITDKVTQDIKNLFPKVVVTELNLTPEEDKNTISLLMRYAIKDTDVDNDNILLEFET